MCMHRWQAGEAERKRAGRHMWTVPTRSSVAGDDSFSSSNLADSFYKVFDFCVLGFVLFLGVMPKMLSTLFYLFLLDRVL